MTNAHFFRVSPLPGATGCRGVATLTERLTAAVPKEQEKFKAITEELEQTFAEMSGY